MKNSFSNRQLIARVLDIAKAHKHEGEMSSSAEVNYKMACDIMFPAWNNDKVDITGADTMALKSLAYSVGLAHPDYIMAKNILA